MKFYHLPGIFIVVVLLLIGITQCRADTPVVIVTDGDMNLPQSVITSEGTYLVIPDYTTGKPMAVIQTSKTKESKND